MSTAPSPSRARRGFAIVTATVVLVALMALAVALSDTTVGSLRMSYARVADTTLTVSTESAANIAFNHLQNLSDLDSELIKAKTRDATDPEAVLTDEVLAIATVDGRLRLNGVDPYATWKWLGTVTIPILGTNEKQDLYQITATAAVAGPARFYNSDTSWNQVQDINRYKRRRVEALFTKFPQSMYRQAMFARQGYSFMGSANTDSWDSKGDGSNPYGSAAKGSNGDLSSEGTIAVQKPESVKGDVNMNVKMPIPPLRYNPAGATPLPSGAAGGVLTTTDIPALPTKTLTTGKYVCTKIVVGKKGSDIIVAPGAKVDLYISGPIVIEGDWRIDKTSTLRIFQDDYDSASGANLSTINGNAVVGCPENPRSFQVYSLYDGKNSETDEPDSIEVKMNGSAQLGGVFFFPFTAFKLNGGFDLFGSLIALSFRETNDPADLGKVNGNFNFHYDESLANLQLPFPPSLVVVGWRSYDLGPPRLANPGATDPARPLDNP